MASTAPPRRNKKRTLTSETEEQQQSYCKRLLHQCRKDLNKHAKAAKSLECQKLIRKTKTTQAKRTSAAAEQQDQKDDQKLKEWRELSLELVLHECFRRLGVLDLLELESHMDDGKAKAAFKRRDEAKAEESNEKINTTSVHSRSIDRVLQHNRMREAIEKWSGQIVEYRNWCSRNTVATGDDSDSSGSVDDDDRKAKDQRRKRQKPNLPTSKSTKSAQKKDNNDEFDLFTTLDGAKDTPQQGKKNRAGQKARRAKAQAIQANREGRSTAFEKSSNWRVSDASKKSAPRHGDLKRQQPPPPPKVEEVLHPSWQARKAHKPIIVTFTGKKTTF
jgi:hypothetical protein